MVTPQPSLFRSSISHRRRSPNSSSQTATLLLTGVADKAMGRTQLVVQSRVFLAPTEQPAPWEHKPTYMATACSPPDPFYQSRHSAPPASVCGSLLYREQTCSHRIVWRSDESTGGRPGYCGASVQEGDTLIHGEGSVSS